VTARRLSSGGHSEPIAVNARGLRSNAALATTVQRYRFTLDPGDRVRIVFGRGHSPGKGIVAPPALLKPSSPKIWDRIAWPSPLHGLVPVPAMRWNQEKG